MPAAFWNITAGHGWAPALAGAKGQPLQNAVPATEQQIDALVPEPEKPVKR